MKHCDHCRSGCSGCRGGCRKRYEITLCDEEAALLRLFAQSPYLPVSRFVMRSSHTEHAESVALEPVFLLSPDDDVKRAAHTAELLLSLAGKGLINISYDEKLQNFDESEITGSPLFSYFLDTVSEGAERFGSVFDRAEAETGSMGLTAIGRRAITLIG